MQADQYCSYCGRELVTKRRSMVIDPRMDWVLLVCPKRRWWNHLHTEIPIRMEVSETVLNYDPITGERIKRGDSK